MKIPATVRKDESEVEKIKRILTTILELAMLIVLLETLDKGGISTFLGNDLTQMVKVVIGFGVTIMGACGIVIGAYLPTRRHRIFRDTQIHLLKYIAILDLFQILAWFMTKETTALSVGAGPGSPIFLHILLMMFSMIAIMMPFNYVKSMFGLLKSVEIRDPRRIMKQFFF